MDRILLSEPRCECHGHVIMDGVDFKSAVLLHKYGPDLAVVRSALYDMEEACVEYFRDGGDALGVSEAARPIALEEFGIDYVTPVFATHKKGRYGGIVGRAFETMADFRALLREAKAAKADFIKVMVSGLLDFSEFGRLSCPSLTAEEMREIAEAAHGEGFAVMAHCNGADAVKAAVAAGIDSIEHGYFMDDAAIADVAASDTIWVPTLAATAGFIDRPGTGEGVAAAIVADQREKLARAAALGAIIASGSDAGAFGVPHATALDRELALLSFLSAEAVDAANAELRRRFRRG